jgi:ribose transport system permease protein
VDRTATRRRHEQGAVTGARSTEARATDPGHATQVRSARGRQGKGSATQDGAEQHIPRRSLPERTQSVGERRTRSTDAHRLGARLAPFKAVGPRNIGAIYVLVVLVVIFSVMSPSVFATLGTAKLVLNEYSVTGLVGLALLLPLSSGLFDLSVGSVAGLSGIAAAWMLAHVTANPLVAVLVGVGVAVVVGVINAGVVLGLGIDSFIGTLATSSIVTAIATAIAGDSTIAKNVNGSFQHDIALVNVSGVTLPVFITLAVAVILFVTLEKTGFGRRTYAIGFDTEVARLGGVRVVAVRTAALITSAVIAGLAGVVATAQIGAGNPATGPNYLIPAFAVAFLGATQFRGGRFNTWGAIVAVLLLGTGDVGLVTVGGPSWSPDVFEGAVLIAAVGLTASQGIGPIKLQRLRQRLADRRRRGTVPSDAGETGGPSAGTGAGDERTLGDVPPSGGTSPAAGAADLRPSGASGPGGSASGTDPSIEVRGTGV